MTLLIVDDEAIERKALKKIVTEGCPDITVVGEATNGRQAIELAEKLAPDIITMDIKMPGVDGVEAVKTIIKKRPKTRFIMVSAFDTFEYARQVMMVGVKEYLLKPNKKEEILAAIERIAGEIEQEKAAQMEHENLETGFQKALSFVESEWVTALLLDHIKDNEMTEWEPILNLNGRPTYAIVCKLVNAANGEANHRWIKAWFSERSQGFVGPLTGGQIPVFTLSRSDQADGGESIQSEAIRLIAQLNLDYQKVFNQKGLRIGIGAPVENVDDFAKSYHEALRALDKTNESVNYLYYHPTLESKKLSNTLLEKERRLVDVIKNGAAGEFQTTYDDYFEELEKQHGKAVQQIRESLYEFWVVTRRALEEIGMPAVPYIVQYKGENTPALKETVKITLLDLVKQIELWKKENMNGVINRAKAYIKENFFRNLSLEDVANHVGLSPYYFSKLFKEHHRATFIEYLTELRMDKAKELMKTTEKSLKEICFEIGYHDPNYFSRVFKKWTNLSPSEYREKGK